MLWPRTLWDERNQVMTTEQALEFLRRHQPMPSDWDIADHEGDTYVAILKHFEAHPDPRCIPLLINSVSPETGLGMYQHIKFVLRAHGTDAVAPYLRTGLVDGNDGVKSRCCEWAVEVASWNLEDVIRTLEEHSDEDVCEAAKFFLDAKAELA
jgi:hypothetical protein